MPDVQIAVWFGWQARADVVEASGLKIFCNSFTDKICWVCFPLNSFGYPLDWIFASLWTVSLPRHLLGNIWLAEKVILVIITNWSCYIIPRGGTHEPGK